MAGRLDELRDPLSEPASGPVAEQPEGRWPHLEGAASLVERGVHLLDNALPIPGTRQRVGLDPLIGLVAPGAGDVIGGAVSLGILFLAVQYRVPAPVIARMVFNIAVDSAVGAVPLAGDAFDAVWKSNHRNFTLLKRHRGAPQQRASLRYWLGVSLLIVLALACVAAPIVLIVWLLSSWLG